MEMEPYSDEFANDPRKQKVDSSARTLGRLHAESSDVDHRRSYQEWEQDVKEATEYSDNWETRSIFESAYNKCKELGNEHEQYEHMRNAILELRRVLKGDKYPDYAPMPKSPTTRYGDWSCIGNDIHIHGNSLENLSMHQRKILARLITNPGHKITVSDICNLSKNGDMERYRAPHQISKIRAKLRAHYSFPKNRAIPKLNGQAETTYILSDEPISEKPE